MMTGAPFLIIVIYVLIGVYVKYDNKKMRGVQSVFMHKRNQTSAYVELKQWKLVWGLMINSQNEANKVIDEWNNNGYTCIGFQNRIIPSVSIIKLLGILIILILTFGFVCFYTGPALLFIRSGAINGEQSGEIDVSAIKVNKPLWEK